MQPNVTFGEVLRNARFFRLWTAQFISSFGDWLAILAIFSLVTFRWQGSPYQIAGIFLTFTAPFAFIGPIAGVFADRWNLKRTMIGSDLIRAVIVAVMALATEIWQLYALMVLLSTVSCFFIPAQGATIPLLVKKEQLLVANALNTQTIHLTKIIGPALAGLLAVSVGPELCFLLDAASFVVSAALIIGIPVERPAVAAAQRRGVEALLYELREGLGFLWRHAALRFVAIAMMTATFAIGFFDALIAPYVRDLLREGAEVFGYMISAIGLGTIVGALVIGKYTQHWSRVLLVVIGIFGLGAGVVLLALATHTWPALAASVVLGVAVGAVIVPSQTLTQEETPHELLGRVTSTSASVTMVSLMIGVILGGALAERFAIRQVYFGVSVALAVIALGGYFFARRHKLTAHRVAANLTPAEAVAAVAAETVVDVPGANPATLTDDPR